MGFFNIFKASKKTVVVDGLSFTEGGNNRIPPRNQLQLLRRLSRFAKKENLKMVVVLSGRPLNKAPGGKDFEGIRICYSKSEDVHGKYLLKTLKGEGRGATLVVESGDVEKSVIDSGLRALRISTFRKAFDSISNEGGDRERGQRSQRRRSGQRQGGGNDRGDRNDRHERADRGERSERAARGDRNDRNERGERPSSDRKPHEKREKTQQDTISELIDLVD